MSDIPVVRIKRKMYREQYRAFVSDKEQDVRSTGQAVQMWNEMSEIMGMHIRGGISRQTTGIASLMY